MSDQSTPIADSVEADQQAANTVVVDDEQGEDGTESTEEDATEGGE